MKHSNQLKVSVVLAIIAGVSLFLIRSCEVSSEKKLTKYWYADGLLCEARTAENNLINCKPYMASEITAPIMYNACNIRAVEI